MPIYSTHISYGLVRRWTQASALRIKEAESFQIYSYLLVTRWRSCGKFRSQKEIKAIYPSTLRMLCAVPISVIVCSSVADRWPDSNCRFWSNPILIVPNAPIITGTIFILAFHILIYYVLDLQVFNCFIIIIIIIIISSSSSSGTSEKLLLWSFPGSPLALVVKVGW